MFIFSWHCCLLLLHYPIIRHIRIWYEGTWLDPFLLAAAWLCPSCLAPVMSHHMSCELEAYGAYLLVFLPPSWSAACFLFLRLREEFNTQYTPGDCIIYYINNSYLVRIYPICTMIFAFIISQIVINFHKWSASFTKSVHVKFRSLENLHACIVCEIYNTYKSCDTMSSSLHHLLGLLPVSEVAPSPPLSTCADDVGFFFVLYSNNYHIAGNYQRVQF